MFDDFDTQICPEEFEDNFIEDEDLYGYDVKYDADEVEYEYEDGWVEFEPGKFIYNEMSANP